MDLPISARWIGSEQDAEDRAKDIEARQADFFPHLFDCPRC
jgi:hypothetical protein